MLTNVVNLIENILRFVAKYHIGYVTDKIGIRCFFDHIKIVEIMIIAADFGGSRDNGKVGKQYVLGTPIFLNHPVPTSCHL